MRTLSLEKLNLDNNLIDDEGGCYLADMIHSLTATKSLSGMTHNLSKMSLDHNPITKRTILRLVHKISSCLSQSDIKVCLSLGWRGYV